MVKCRATVSVSNCRAFEVEPDGTVAVQAESVVEKSAVKPFPPFVVAAGDITVGTHHAAPDFEQADLTGIQRFEQMARRGQL